MMDVEIGQYYCLNGIGPGIWRDLATPIEVAGLCRQMKTEYDTPPDLIQRQVFRFSNPRLDQRVIRVEA